jgi:UDP-glucose 4-epimerase
LLEAPDVVGEVVNVGRPDEVSINHLAERVRDLADSSSEITHIPYEEVYGPGFEDMKRRTPDISKLRSTIDFEPAFTLEEILQAVIENTRSQSTEAERAPRLAQFDAFEA